MYTLINYHGTKSQKFVGCQNVNCVHSMWLSVFTILTPFEPMPAKMVPMAMNLIAPMVHPIAIGANDDCTIGDHWCNFNGSIGAISWRCVFHNRQWKPMTSMTSLESMVPLETLAILWCKWRFIGVMDAIGVNGASGTNDSCGVIDFNVQWHVWNVEDTSRHSMMPLVPMTSLVPLKPLMPTSPMELFSPLTQMSPLVLLSTLPLLYDQCTMIVSNGSSLSPLATILPLSPLQSPLVSSTFNENVILHIATKWRQWIHVKWSQMMIVIGANSDWRKWREFQIVVTLLSIPVQNISQLRLFINNRAKREFQDYFLNCNRRQTNTN